MRTQAASLSIVALFSLQAWAAPGEGIDGASGNICKVDLERQSF